MSDKKEKKVRIKTPKPVPRQLYSASEKKYVDIDEVDQILDVEKKITVQYVITGKKDGKALKKKMSEEDYIELRKITDKLNQFTIDSLP